MTPKFDQLVNEWAGLAAKAGKVGYKALRKLKVPKSIARQAIKRAPGVAKIGAGVAGGAALKGAHGKRVSDQYDHDPGLVCDLVGISREHPDCQEYIIARNAGDEEGRTKFRNKYGHLLKAFSPEVQRSKLAASEERSGHKKGRWSTFVRGVSKGAEAKQEGKPFIQSTRQMIDTERTARAASQAQQRSNPYASDRRTT